MWDIITDMGFDGRSCAVLTAVHEQSADISQGVSNAQETRLQEGGSPMTGAGDQGMMFGYACDETPELLPIPIALAHRLARQLAKVRKNGQLSWLRPDGKTQVSFVYDQGKPIVLDNIVISTQHADDVDQCTIRDALMELVINPVVPRLYRR